MSESIAADFAASLRRMAEWVEAHSELITSQYECCASVSIGTFDLAEFSAKTALFGAGDKFDQYGTIGLRKDFGDGFVTAEVRIPKETSCVRRETGETKTVTKIVAASEVPDGASVVSTRVTIEVEEPVYEWDCPGSFRAAS